MARFVVADDLPIPRNMLRQMLGNNGHEVVGIATNGQEAIDLCRQFAPDAVILDISMPVVTGDAAARVIIAQQLAKHVIMASSLGQAAIREPLIALGAHFVTKPYHRLQLLDELATIEL